MFYRILTFSILAFSVLVLGCNNNRLGQPNTGYAIIVWTDYEDNNTNYDVVSDIPYCKVGDILSVGNSCKDEGTDATFTVLENGNGSYTSVSGLLSEGTDDVYVDGETLNDSIYYFNARRIDGNSWRIEKLEPDDFE